MKSIFSSILVLLILSVFWGTGDALAQNDLKVVCKEGTFLFKHLSIKPYENNTMMDITGELINNTDKDWDKVTFIVDMWDINGIKLISAHEKKETPITISFTNIMKNKSYEISKTLYVKREHPTKEEMEEADSFKRYMKSQQIELEKYKVRFKSGSHLAQYRLTMTKPRLSKDLSFEDSKIKIKFTFSDDGILFAVRNKTSNLINIDWNKISYIDASGMSHRVIHSGVDFSDKDRVQTPTTLPPTAYITDVIIPSDYIYQIPLYGVGLVWTKRALFPKDAEKAKEYEGKSVGLFMPLKVNGILANYLFSFKIVF